MTVLAPGGRNNDAQVVKLNARLIQVEDGLGAVIKERKEEKRTSEAEGSWLCCILIIFAIGGIGKLAQLALSPATVPPPSTDRTVNLTMINGSYGLVINGRYIEEDTRGGAADLQGGLKRGDEILKVNGDSVFNYYHRGIINKIREKDGHVELTVNDCITAV